MSLFSEIEKTIERGFRHWTERLFGPAQAGDLITLHRAILEEIESRVEIMPRGRRVFPFGRVIVAVPETDPGRRTLLETAFAERLGEDVAESMRAVGCELPEGFAVEVRAGGDAPSPFAIQYEPVRTQPQAQPAAAAAATAPPTEPVPALAPARLIVVKGKAEHTEYALEKARVNLGRLAELTDSDQRMTRRNDVVFEEGTDEANATVSRKHAHIRRDGADYRLCDDGSEFGTRVFRDGRSIDVPSGNRRGEKLRPGDEIYLGRACLRFER
jgi:hypothetical protein